jgi:streptogramin lyase/anti-sigma factor RsiW
VLELISATFDDQASQPDRAVAERHLASCQGCSAQVQAWLSVSEILRTLPAGMPSARVDEVVARLANPPRRVRRPAFPTLAPRLGIAGAAIVAVIVSGLPVAQQPGATPALEQGEDRIIVAAAQQIVYNARNNTLYQLDTATAAVNALEPGSNDLKTRIPVGGQPIRLALNETANTILVLDAVQKRVTEIDAASNTVISATNVDGLTGTPTSINVDNTGKIVVTSVSTPAASSAPGGTVTVLDSSTKQLETVREIDVAPRMVVVDPLSNQAVLVSPSTTKLVDSSYKVIATLPGGVAAAFSRRGDGVAVLSPTGPDTTITFAGALAPAALRLQGSPRAITALKEGGYLVLLQIDGQGRVVKISPEGRSEGSVSIASVVGGDLLYDEATNLFTVANGGTVASAQVPVTAASATSASPTAQATTLASPTASSAPLATAPSTATPEPAKAPRPSPVVAASSPDVIDSAKSIASGLYSASLPSGLRPHLMATNGSRIWFVDQASRVGTFDMSTGEVKTIAKLRADARVGYWVPGRSFVFGVDPANGQVHVVNTVTESVDSFATNVLSPVSAVAVGRDDRLWLALRDASYLLAFDPRTHGMDSFDLLGGARVNALAIDTLGRVVYSDDLHETVGTFDPTTLRLRENGLTRRGSTTALTVDGSGTLWLGTSTGDIYSVRDGSARQALNVRTPVSSLALDRSGRAWYLAPIPNGIPGFAYAPADGSQAVRSIPGPAVGLAFSEAGRTFSADPRGAFDVAAEDGR